MVVVVPVVGRTYLVPMVQGARYAVSYVQANQVIQAANRSVATPVTFVVAAVAAASGVGGLVGFQQFGLLLLAQGSLLFRRRKGLAFGVVYDWSTKLPVDLALVRLVDAATGRVVANRVTDRQGRFLIIAPPGSYRLEVRKDGYAFPSPAIARAETDAQYGDLYFGDVLAMPQGGPVTLSVPLDLVADRRSDRRVVRDAMLTHLRSAVVFVAPAVALVSYALTPKAVQLAVLVLSLVLAAVFLRFQRRRPKSWGVVRDERGRPVANAVVRIVETGYDKVLESVMTDARGRYAFLVGRNSYYLRFDKAGYEPLKSGILDFKNEAKPSVAAVDIKLKKAS